MDRASWQQNQRQQQQQQRAPEFLKPTSSSSSSSSSTGSGTVDLAPTAGLADHCTKLAKKSSFVADEAIDT